ncbi:hypothetical protein D918_04959, partial [Trichuris suis]
LCKNCRNTSVRKRLGEINCQVCQCTVQPRRYRTHRSLPADFFELDMALQRRLLAEYRLSPLAFKCCFDCFNKIKKKINNFLKFYDDEVSDDEPCSSTISDFTVEEQCMLRDVLFAGCCSSWDEVASRIPNKTAKECRRQAFENKSEIFDCTLLTSATDVSAHEHAESNTEGRNVSESIGALSDSTTIVSAQNAECDAVEPKYTRLRAVLNAGSGAETATTSEQAPQQGVEPSGDHASPKPSWNVKFAFHPSYPCAKLQEEAMVNTSAATKRNSDSRRSTRDTSFTSPKDVGANGVAASLENASVGRRSAVMSTSPPDVESSSFNVRPISGGCSSISSETGSGIHLNNSSYPNSFGALPIMPLSLGPGHSLNNWYASGISPSTNGTFGGQPIDLGAGKPMPTAERLYSNLYSPNVNGSAQYSIGSAFSTQQHEPGGSSSGLLNAVPSAEQRKRLLQGSPAEGINPKMICNGISASIPTVSATYAGVGQNNLNAPFAGSAYQSLNGFTFNPSAQVYQYPGFAGGYQDESATNLISQFNLNGYGANPFYAAGTNYRQAVQNGLLQSAGIPLFNYGFNPYGYGVGNVSDRRIAETPETAIPTAGGVSSIAGSSSGGSSTRDKRRVEQVFTFLDCSDDETS